MVWPDGHGESSGVLLEHLHSAELRRASVTGFKSLFEFVLSLSGSGLYSTCRSVYNSESHLKRLDLVLNNCA